MVPTVEGLADELWYGTKALYNWAKEHPEFQDVLDRLKAKPGRLTQAKGLKKETATRSRSSGFRRITGCERRRRLR